MLEMGVWAKAERFTTLIGHSCSTVLLKTILPRAAKRATPARVAPPDCPVIPGTLEKAQSAPARASIMSTFLMWQTALSLTTHAAEAAVRRLGSKAMAWERM